jgi:hypothetical protein
MDTNDDHRMPWEDYAQEAIENIIGEADFDEIRGIIVLSPHYNDGSESGVECTNMEQLRQYLIEVYIEEWYAYVPFDGGEAVFEDDASGAVADLLADNPEIDTFFELNTAPAGSETIVTAQELLRDFKTWRIVRVSLEEINEELICYLADNPEKMREMSPRKFEELVADMFRNQGYDVTLTTRSYDGGMDVIAVQRSDIGTVMTIVECKRYAEDKKVGVDIVRGLYGVVEQKRATRGIIATTSFFTRGAKTFRSNIPYRLGLADFNVLTQEIKKWKDQIKR